MNGPRLVQLALNVEHDRGPLHVVVTLTPTDPTGAVVTALDGPAHHPATRVALDARESVPVIADSLGISGSAVGAMLRHLIDAARQLAADAGAELADRRQADRRVTS